MFSNFFSISELKAGFLNFIGILYLFLALKGFFPDPEGLDLMTSLCVSMAFGSLLMGLLGRAPIAVAPGIGLASYLQYSLMGAHQFTYERALGFSLLAGVLALCLAISGFRSKFIDIVPLGIKKGISVGIGLLLLRVGLRDIGEPIFLKEFMLGAGLLAVFLFFRLKLAFFLTLLVGTLLLRFWDVLGANFFAWPTSPRIMVPSFDTELNIENLGLLMSLTTVYIFDTSGGFLALSSLTAPRRGNKIFVAEAIGTIFNAFLGLSASALLIESKFGLGAGRKTEGTALWTGVFALTGIFFVPLFSMIPYSLSSTLLAGLGGMIVWPSLKNGVGLFAELATFRNKVSFLLSALTPPMFFSLGYGLALGFISYFVIFLGTFFASYISKRNSFGGQHGKNP